MNERESAQELAQRAEEAAKRAKEKARIARWDLNMVIFLFAILTIVIIMLFEGFGTEIVAPIGFLGFAICWLIGWRRGKQLYERFYDEEWRREREAYELSHDRDLSKHEKDQA